MRQLPQENIVNIPLTQDEALVLVEWLNTYLHQGSLPTTDKAELVVLWRIEGCLEHVLSQLNDPDYQQLVMTARRNVSPIKTP